MTSRPDDDFNHLLEASSLGASAARLLRERTSLPQAHSVRRITELREPLPHPDDAPHAADPSVHEGHDLLPRTQDHARNEPTDHPHPPRQQSPTSSAPARLTTATALTTQRGRPAATILADQEHASLTEIELCGELMIAASAESGPRLSQSRIDEVLQVTTDHTCTTRHS